VKAANAWSRRKVEYDMRFLLAWLLGVPGILVLLWLLLSR
jgi:hypothetical protein